VKFKDKDGNIIGDIYDVVADYCFSRRCEDCHCLLFDVHRGCRTDLVEESPVESARLMGYDIVWEEQEANMENQSSKPLKDWTLEEARNYCRGIICFECWFYDDKEGSDSFCRLAPDPEKWNFLDPPRFTPEEVEDAQTLKRLFPDIAGLKREDSHALKAIMRGSYTEYFIYPELFPSIQPGESVSISDILGGGA